MKFIRNTHDENGNYRGEAYFGYVEGQYLDNEYEGLGVYAWMGSGDELSLEEFVEEHKVYAKQYPDSPCPSMPELLKALAILIERKLVIVKE